MTTNQEMLEYSYDALWYGGEGNGEKYTAGILPIVFHSQEFILAIQATVNKLETQVTELSTENAALKTELDTVNTKLDGLLIAIRNIPQATGAVADPIAIATAVAHIFSSRLQN